MLGLWLLARRPTSPRSVIGLVVAIQLIPLAAPLLLSTDPLSYVAWGKLSQPFVLHGAWPPIETYGPLWAMISEPIARLNGGVFAFRVLAALGILVIVGLVWRLAKRKPLAAAFVGWNPFVALHYAGGGHNDALMMAFVLGGIVLAGAGSPQLGGASWATSMALKWTSAWFFLLWAIERYRQRKPIGVPGFVLACAVLVGAAFAHYGTAWPHAISSLSQQLTIDHPSTGSLGYVEDLGLSRRPALALIAIFELAMVAVFIWAAWQRRLRLGLAAGILVLLSPRLDPWYLLWAIALAASDDDDRWGRALAVALTGFLLIDVFSHIAEG